MAKKTTIADLEDQAYEEQVKWIENKFGSQAPLVANYGWGVDESDTHIFISTKIYGYGVLLTTINLDTGKIEHRLKEIEGN